MSFHGAKFSKSRGGAVDVLYYLSNYDLDALGMFLTAVARETRDTEFSWEDSVERNNHVLSANEGNELVATWGSLSNRMLSFAYERFDGHVSEPDDPSSPSAQGLDTADRELLAKVEGGLPGGGRPTGICKFRAALGAAMALAREANVYTFATLSAGVDRKAPGSRPKRIGERGDDGLRRPAGCTQPEDDPVALPAPHDPATARIRRCVAWTRPSGSAWDQCPSTV